MHVIDRLQGWQDLEDKLNNTPVKQGEPVLLFCESSDEDHSLILFNIPDLGERKFKVSDRHDGETVGDYIDKYTVIVDFPADMGYYSILIGHIQDVSAPRKIPSANSHTFSGMFGSENIVLAYGRKGIEYLLTNPPIVDDLNRKLGPSYDGIKQVMKEMGGQDG